MVHFKSIFGAALLATLIHARPMPQDSAVGDEVGVSAPDGTPITDSVELASQTAAEAAAKTGEVRVQIGEPAASSAAAQPHVTQPAAHEPAPPAAHETTTTQHNPQPTYGSGSSTWGNGQQYDDCVQQCIASHGSPPVTWQPTATAGHGGSTPTAGAAAGATHTVIVAPRQGVLRYVPFAVNATIGDTILFQWGANNHTVTKGSQLTPCNKTEDALFTSGLQVKDFQFTQVVNTTEPTYFFCNAPTHCEKGMFGIINPPNAFGAPSTVAGQMPNITSQNPDVKAMATYTENKTKDVPSAATWGRSIDLAQMPTWSHKLVMENVMYTRSFLAENPETMGEDGVTLAGASATPLLFPDDITTVINNAGTANAPGNAAAQPAIPSGETSTSTESAGPSAPSNGAMSMSPSMTVGLFTAAAAFFLL